MEKDKIRILFADDEFAIRMTLSKILELEGFQVAAAATVAEALELINHEKFDVLLADLNLGQPGDGFTLISAMRRVQPTAITLILTGYPDFDSALQAIRNQVDDYLTKPADIKKLVAMIKEKSQQPKGVSPRFEVKRLSAVLRESASRILEEWLIKANQNAALSSIPLDRELRLDHLRQIIEELAQRIESGPNVLSHQEKSGAATHGRERYRQGYTVRDMAIEARLLHLVISTVLYEHLLSMDMSTFVSDMIVLGEGLHEEFEESLQSYEEAQSGAPRVA